MMDDGSTLDKVNQKLRLKLELITKHAVSELIKPHCLKINFSKEYKNVLLNTTIAKIQTQPLVSLILFEAIICQDSTLTSNAGKIIFKREVSLHSLNVSTFCVIEEKIESTKITFYRNVLFRNFLDCCYFIVTHIVTCSNTFTYRAYILYYVRFCRCEIHFQRKLHLP